jgi:hypothetical protein
MVAIRPPEDHLTHDRSLTLTVAVRVRVSPCTVKGQEQSVYRHLLVDSISDYLSRRGVGPHVIEGGLSYLLQKWERLASQLEDGSTAWDEDEWLNELDVREILHSLLQDVPEAATALPEISAIDARFAAAAIETAECAWGQRVAGRRGWTQQVNWWYWRKPPTPYT